MRRSKVADPPSQPGKNRNIYERVNAQGKTIYEVFYRDETGKQHFHAVGEKLSDARAYRDDKAGRKARGESIRSVRTLTFGEVANAWLDGPVSTLRPKTQESYKTAVKTHLLDRWGKRRLDSIDADDVARLVRDLREKALSEWTITGVVNAVRQIFRYAAQRKGFVGTNPVSLLGKGERPTPSQTQRRRIYQGTELQETIAAAHEPFRTLFILAAVTGGRLSELLGLQWSDVDLEDGTCMFQAQVDRKGNLHPLKTEESRRTVPLANFLVSILREHKLRSPNSPFVFCTSSGRPFSQRNVMRALRLAQTKAKTKEGRHTFPVLHEDRPVNHGELPSFHSFRHSAASQLIADGISAEEVAFQLGHRNSNVTRMVYVQELKSARKQAEIRDQQDKTYGAMFGQEAQSGSSGSNVVALHR